MIDPRAMRSSTSYSPRPLTRRVWLSVAAMSMTFAPMACNGGGNAADIAVIGCCGFAALVLDKEERTTGTADKLSKCPACPVSHKCNIFTDPPTCMPHPGRLGEVCGSVKNIPEATFECGEGFFCRDHAAEKQPSRCGVAQQSRAEGPCASTLDCAYVYSCNRTADQNGTCGPKIAAGKLCEGLTAREECQKGLVCHNEPGKFGTCGAVHKSGEPCWEQHDCGDDTGRTYLCVKEPDQPRGVCQLP